MDIEKIRDMILDLSTQLYEEKEPTECIALQNKINTLLQVYAYCSD